MTAVSLRATKTREARTIDRLFSAVCPWAFSVVSFLAQFYFPDNNNHLKWAFLNCFFRQIPPPATAATGRFLGVFLRVATARLSHRAFFFSAVFCGCSRQFKPQQPGVFSRGWLPAALLPQPNSLLPPHPKATVFCPHRRHNPISSFLRVQKPPFSARITPEFAASHPPLLPASTSHGTSTTRRPSAQKAPHGHPVSQRAHAPSQGFSQRVHVRSAGMRQHLRGLRPRLFPLPKRRVCGLSSADG